VCEATSFLTGPNFFQSAGTARFELMTPDTAFTILELALAIFIVVATFGLLAFMLRK
jgi:hypothetical protein